MPRFQPKRHEQIFAQMIARLVARTNLSDVGDTSVWKHVLAACARQDDEQYYQMALLLQLFSIDTATGDDLDERAKDIQPAVIYRVQAVKSTGTVVFYRTGTTGTVVIPIGTKVKTADGRVFTTTTTGTITPTSAALIGGHSVGQDSGLVSVIADEAGLSGNASSGTVVKFESKPAGVDGVTNLTSFAWGLDKETDDHFRQRLKDFVRGLARCTVQAIEAGVVGQVDEDTGATILFANVVEDIIDRGNVYLYVDDGTGTAEAIEDVAVALTPTLTWNGTTTVITADTSEADVGDWIRLDGDGQWFEISVVTPGVSYTILNPGSDTIPTGSTQSSKASDILTEGFSPTDEAVGGETRLRLDYYPIKEDLPIMLATDVQGNLVDGVDYTINPASGDIVMTSALVAGEQVVAGYTRYTGLIEFAQKVVDGDPNDRPNFPGLRAAGVLVRVWSPQVLIQNITAVVTVTEGYDQSLVVANAIQAVKDHINTLSISDDVILAALTQKVMAVAGVRNVDFLTPTDDVIILDDQIARTTDANVDIT